MVLEGENFSCVTMRHLCQLLLRVKEATCMLDSATQIDKKNSQTTGNLGEYTAYLMMWILITRRIKTLLSWSIKLISGHLRIPVDGGKEIA